MECKHCSIERSNTTECVDDSVLVSQGVSQQKLKTASFTKYMTEENIP